MPEVGRSSPAATLRNVLLPEPEGPMIAVNEPRGSVDADAVECDDRAVALAVDLADVAEGDSGRGGGRLGSVGSWTGAWSALSRSRRAAPSRPARVLHSGALVPRGAGSRTVRGRSPWTRVG